MQQNLKKPYVDAVHYSGEMTSMIAKYILDEIRDRGLRRDSRRQTDFEGWQESPYITTILIGLPILGVIQNLDPSCLLLSKDFGKKIEREAKGLENGDRMHR
jgi:hypothetical protein